MTKDKFLHRFEVSVEQISLPSSFNYPFYYTPHEIAKTAASQLQSYLENQSDFKHNFGLSDYTEGMVIGKMFGVLVVQDQNEKLGFLAGVSGKLGESNNHLFFVPPVYDMLSEQSYFKKDEEGINALNDEIEALETSSYYAWLKEFNSTENLLSESLINEAKKHFKTKKLDRKSKRSELQELNQTQEIIEQIDALNRQSILEQLRLKDFIHSWKIRRERTKDELTNYEESIKGLKKLRREKSNELQDKLFDSYFFHNAELEQKSLLQIFGDFSSSKPPAGAGECAAPKLLEYAYQHNYKPIALAEFWWGASPKSEVRQHKAYYPACRGKCEPILSHMLKGLVVDPNPMLENPAEGKELPIIFEDDLIVVVNKPAEFLSVPGKQISDSVYTRIKNAYPDADGPLIVHRLDMSTSGILLLAKTKYAHEYLQRQFIKKTIQKKYIALLNGAIQNSSGVIELPLRVDLDDRPRQMVCYDHGKHAKTLWKVLDIQGNKTRIEFTPITGRTHQLRVHAAHHLGLNTPILGDDLYGTKANRLHLHAAELTFTHPQTKESISINCPAPF